MFILRTGLPGASKTLNLIAETCTAQYITDETNIYYNNIKNLFLDFAVCDSFSGFFYGHYLPELNKTETRKIQKLLRKIHGDDRLASLDDFPFLNSDFDMYLSTNQPLELFLKWASRAYKSERLQPLLDYVALRGDEKISFEELTQFNLDWRYFDDPRSWFELPRGSVCIVDECQRFFPPRPIGSARPRYISEIETHRHYGIILSFVTQDPKLLDSDARRLVTKHIHYENKFGSNRVLRFDGNKVFDMSDYHAKQGTIKNVITRPSKLYGLYHSADVHYSDFRLPPKVILFFVLIIAAVVSLFILFRLITSIGSDKNPEPVLSDFTFEREISIENEAQADLQNLSVVPRLHSQIIHPFSYCDELTLSYVQHFRFMGMTRTQPHFECVEEVKDSEPKIAYISPHLLRELGYNYEITRTIIRLKYDGNSIIYENILN